MLDIGSNSDLIINEMLTLHVSQGFKVSFLKTDFCLKIYALTVHKSKGFEEGVQVKVSYCGGYRGLQRLQLKLLLKECAPLLVMIGHMNSENNHERQQCVGLGVLLVTKTSFYFLWARNHYTIFIIQSPCNLSWASYGDKHFVKLKSRSVYFHIMLATFVKLQNFIHTSKTGKPLHVFALCYRVLYFSFNIVKTTKQLP